MKPQMKFKGAKYPNDGMKPSLGEPRGSTMKGCWPEYPKWPEFKDKGI